MTLSSTSKKLLVVALVLIGVGVVMLALAPRSQAPQHTSSEMNSTDTNLPVADLPQPVPKINLYVQSDPTEQSVLLDSENKKITAISIRFRADKNAVVKQNWFSLDPSLKEQGWQAVINTASPYDPEAEYALFDLALINTRPDGGTVFTTDAPFGTFANGSVYDLDPSISMATTQEGNQLDLQLVREE